MEEIHNKGFIHRSIKPENFILCKRNHILYLINYGISKSFLDDCGDHIDPTFYNKPIGNV